MVTQENIGQTDSDLRVVAGLFLVILYITKIVSGNLNYVILFISMVLAWTGVLRSCEPYTWLGIHTNKKPVRIPEKRILLVTLDVIIVYAMILLFF